VRTTLRGGTATVVVDVTVVVVEDVVVDRDRWAAAGATAATVTERTAPAAAMAAAATISGHLRRGPGDRRARARDMGVCIGPGRGSLRLCSSDRADR
jgi:hypothetical protein